MPRMFPPSLTARCLLQRGAATGDDAAVPVEGFLPVSPQGACAVVVAVNVDEALSLAHPRCGGADQIDGRP